MRYRQEGDKPAIFEIFGLCFYFCSDEYEPIHVCVVKADDDAKTELFPEVRLVYSHGLKAKDLKRALQLAGMYREEIVKKWHGYSVPALGSMFPKWQEALASTKV